MRDGRARVSPAQPTKVGFLDGRRVLHGRAQRHRPGSAQGIHGGSEGGGLGSAEIVAADEAAITYEGDPRGRVVILRFPSQEAVDEWYKSEAYQKALPLRLNSISDNWAGVVKAFD